MVEFEDKYSKVSASCEKDIPVHIYQRIKYQVTVLRIRTWRQNVIANDHFRTRDEDSMAPYFSLKLFKPENGKPRLGLITYLEAKRGNISQNVSG